MSTQSNETARQKLRRLKHERQQRLSKQSSTDELPEMVDMKGLTVDRLGPSTPLEPTPKKVVEKGPAGAVDLGRDGAPSGRSHDYLGRGVPEDDGGATPAGAVVTEPQAKEPSATPLRDQAIRREHARHRGSYDRQAAEADVTVMRARVLGSYTSGRMVTDADGTSRKETVWELLHDRAAKQYTAGNADSPAAALHVELNRKWKNGKTALQMADERIPQLSGGKTPGTLGELRQQLAAGQREMNRVNKQIRERAQSQSYGMEM